MNWQLRLSNSTTAELSAARDRIASRSRNERSDPNLPQRGKDGLTEAQKQALQHADGDKDGKKMPMPHRPRTDRDPRHTEEPANSLQVVTVATSCDEAHLIYAQSERAAMQALMRPLKLQVLSRATVGDRDCTASAQDWHDAHRWQISDGTHTAHCALRGAVSSLQQLLAERGVHCVAATEPLALINSQVRAAISGGGLVQNSQREAPVFVGPNAPQVQMPVPERDPPLNPKSTHQLDDRLARTELKIEQQVEQKTDAVQPAEQTGIVNGEGGLPGGSVGLASLEMADGTPSALPFDNDAQRNRLAQNWQNNVIDKTSYSLGVMQMTAKTSPLLFEKLAMLRKTMGTLPGQTVPDKFAPHMSDRPHDPLPSQPANPGWMPSVMTAAAETIHRPGPSPADHSVTLRAVRGANPRRYVVNLNNRVVGHVKELDGQRWEATHHATEHKLETAGDHQVAARRLVGFHLKQPERAAVHPERAALTNVEMSATAATPGLQLEANAAGNSYVVRLDRTPLGFVSQLGQRWTATHMQHGLIAGNSATAAEAAGALFKRETGHALVPETARMPRKTRKLFARHGLQEQQHAGHLRTDQLPAFHQSMQKAGFNYVKRATGGGEYLKPDLSEQVNLLPQRDPEHEQGMHYAVRYAHHSLTAHTETSRNSPADGTLDATLSARQNLRQAGFSSTAPNPVRSVDPDTGRPTSSGGPGDLYHTGANPADVHEALQKAGFAPKDSGHYNYAHPSGVEARTARNGANQTTRVHFKSPDPEGAAMLKGQPCLALYTDGQFYPATYERQRSSGLHRITWLDGGERADTASVRPSIEAATAGIEVANRTLTRRAGRAANKIFTPGHSVAAPYEDGEHYGATYLHKNADGTHRVRWHDGSGEANVESVQPHWKATAGDEEASTRGMVGDKVKAKWAGDNHQHWHPATLTSIHNGGKTATVKYDDDGSTAILPHYHIKTRRVVGDRQHERDEGPVAHHFTNHGLEHLGTRKRRGATWHEFKGEVGKPVDHAPILHSLKQAGYKMEKSDGVLPPDPKYTSQRFKRKNADGSIDTGTLVTRHRGNKSVTEAQHIHYHADPMHTER